MVGVLAVGLILLALPFMLLQMFSPSRQASALQVDQLYRRIRRLLAWAGLPADPSVTPDEYLARYAGQLEPYFQLSQALRQTTSLYREMAYSPHSPDGQRVRIASQYWQNSIPDWLVLWLKAAWKRFRSRLNEE
jgi:hypothetical protein